VVYEIDAVLGQWYEPSVTYFKVQSTERNRIVLRHDEVADEWTLQSGFDGDELPARPSIELRHSRFYDCKEGRTANLNRVNTASLPMRRFRSTGV
jgi:hypothetical protein